MHALTSREAPRSGAVAGGSAGDVGRLRPVMACLFAGNLAGNCDAAVDTWPVIHSSTASVISGDRIIVGACAITARRRRSGAAIAIAGTAGARSGGSGAAAILALAAL